MKEYKFFLGSILLTSLFLFNCGASYKKDYETLTYEYKDSVTNAKLKASYYSHWLLLKIDTSHFGDSLWLTNLLIEIKKIDRDAKIHELNIDYYSFNNFEKIIKKSLHPKRVNILNTNNTDNGAILIRLSDSKETKKKDIANLEKKLVKNSYVDFNWLITNEFTYQKNNNKYLFEHVNYSDIINDSLCKKQWYLNHVNADSGFWSFLSGLNINYSNVALFIMDSGIRLDSSNTIVNHEDLYDPSRFFLDHNYKYLYSNNISEDNVNDDLGHGTVIAGLIGAIQNNLVGITGLCPQCKIFICKISQKDSKNEKLGYDLQTSYIRKAINAAVDYAEISNAKVVINLSCIIESEYLPKDLEDALKRAEKSSKIIIVCGTGNDKELVGYPAKLSSEKDFIISVGSTDYSDITCRFSNFARNSLKDITLVAPGLGMYSTIYEGYDKYGDFTGKYLNDGTSFSAPLVTATVALIWNINPELTPAEVKNILIKSCKKIPQMYGEDWNYKTGHGLLNVKAAVDSTLKTLLK